MKALINLTTTLDNSLSGIFLYQMISLRELRIDLARRQSSSSSHNTQEAQPLQALAQLVSPYVYSHLGRQMRLYQRQSATYAASRDGRAIIVKTKDSEHVVDTNVWWCTCLFFGIHRIPCSPIFFAIIGVQQVPVIPSSVLIRRWNFHEATTILPTLYRMNDVLHFVRNSDFNGSAGENAVAHLPGVDTKIELLPRVRYRKLEKEERGDCEVRTDAEKFNIVQVVLRPLIQQLQNSASRQFYKKVQFVGEVVSALTAELRLMDSMAHQPKHTKEPRVEEVEKHVESVFDNEQAFGFAGHY